MCGRVLGGHCRESEGPPPCSVWCNGIVDLSWEQATPAAEKKRHRNIPSDSWNNPERRRYGPSSENSGFCPRPLLPSAGNTLMRCHRDLSIRKLHCGITVELRESILHPGTSDSPTGESLNLWNSLQFNFLTAAIYLVQGPSIGPHSA